MPLPHRTSRICRLVPGQERVPGQSLGTCASSETPDSAGGFGVSRGAHAARPSPGTMPGAWLGTGSSPH